MFINVKLSLYSRLSGQDKIEADDTVLFDVLSLDLGLLQGGFRPRKPTFEE